MPTALLRFLLRPLPPRAVWAGLALTAAALGWLALTWADLGVAFYARVLPFYDSMWYQESFDAVVARSRAHGALATAAAVWREPGNNVVLYKFFAALLGGVLPAGKAGLFVYLLGLHLAALAAVLGAVRGATGSLALALWAGAGVLAAWPFGQAVNGVLDQRMDLASASCYTVVVALGLRWARRPSAARAGLLGLAVALALLHRPVLAVSAVAVVAAWGVRAVARHRTIGARRWWWQAALLVLPGAVLTVPWLAAHAPALYRYYFVANVDVRSARSLQEALNYNVANAWLAVGPVYLGLVAVGLGVVAWWRRLDGGDLAVLAWAGLLPLGLLIASGSVGNYLVCQMPLGVLALGLAAAKPAPERVRAEPWIAVVLAAAVAGLVTHDALKLLRHQISILRPETRPEAARAARELAAEAQGGTVAGFQASPIDLIGLASLAREEGVELRRGTLGFHPGHFGLSNAEAKTLAPAALEAALVRTVERMKGGDAVVMLPTEESQARLPAVPYSHGLLPLLRRLVERDPVFVRVRTVGPIDGVSFDVFAIRRPPG